MDFRLGGLGEPPLIDATLALIIQEILDNYKQLPGFFPLVAGATCTGVQRQCHEDSWDTAVAAIPRLQPLHQTFKTTSCICLI